MVVIYIDVPFSLTVGGGWGQAGNRIVIDLRKVLSDAVKEGVISSKYTVNSVGIYVSCSGLEPPIAGASKVIANGYIVAQWDAYRKQCNDYISIPVAESIDVVAEKTGFGWIGGFTVTGTVKVGVDTEYSKYPSGSLVSIPPVSGMDNMFIIIAVVIAVIVIAVVSYIVIKKRYYRHIYELAKRFI